MTVQIVEQTRDEKIAMYMKMPKRALIEMLLVNQDIVAAYMKQPPAFPQQGVFHSPPMGCICPPGIVCLNSMCPRRPLLGAAFTCDMPQPSAPSPHRRRRSGRERPK